MPLPPGAYLVETSCLVRLSDPTSPAHPIVEEALRKLNTRNVGAVPSPLYIAPQCIVEFWSVATRPTTSNGLGMTPAEAFARVQTLRSLFGLLLETPDIYANWEKLIVAAQVSGRQVHDTRLVAFMQSNYIPYILTLNAKDFRRFEPLAGIKVVEPGDV